MNILYFSSLINSYSSGTSWSVPALIKAQEKVDNCFWVETNDTDLQYLSNVKAHQNLYNTFSNISALPYPFNKPSLVIFVGIYAPKYLGLARELINLKIPYIIQPASSLTYQAQHNHAFIKKKIANFFLFNRFIRGASAIWYLTEDERRDSGTKWNKHSFVLPNGINMPSKSRTNFTVNGIKSVYIGRIDIYQKGLDLLVEAINILQVQLRNANFSLKVFGPTNKDAKTISSKIKRYNIGDIVLLCGEVSGPEKEAAFRDNDLFVLTSRFEGHSIALLEALSYGLPVATTPGANMKQKIRQYDAGWCSDETSVESICDMLLTIIRDTDSFATKGRNAIELAKTYNYDEIAKQFHEIAWDIVNGNYR